MMDSAKEYDRMVEQSNKQQEEIAVLRQQIEDSRKQEPVGNFFIAAYGWGKVDPEFVDDPEIAGWHIPLYAESKGGE